MTAKSGSVAWLVAHDLTLNWRRFLNMFGRLPPAAIVAVCLVGAVILHLLAWPLVLWLPSLKLANGASPAVGGGLVVVLAWMSAQGLLGSARTLQDRAGMDLMLASPLPVRQIVAARLASIAASSFASVALLLLPLANAGAIVDGPAWLAAYPMLIALALIGTVVGMTTAVGLFLWLEPRRARIVAQLCAAFVGGAFLLAMQVGAMLPASSRDAISSYFAQSAVFELLQPVAAGAQGELLALAGVVLFAITLAAAAVAFLSAGFRQASLHAASAHHGASADRAGRASMRVGSGLRQTLHRKEWRLLLRDHGVFTQLALQIIYTVPLAVVLLRSIDNMPVVMAVAPTIVVIAAQIAASLAWITVSGEDAPELIAAAPVQRMHVEMAKITAIGAPVLAIVALPLAGLALLHPSIALLAAGFAAAASVCTALLNLWHPMPGNRRGMLRRHSQSKLMALLEHLMAMLWAVAIVLALIGSMWTLLPIALALGILACCRPAGGIAARS